MLLLMHVIECSFQNMLLYRHDLLNKFEKMKTRFAPSPTGLIHLGNARTALFSALYGVGQQGVFLLRVEDTDKARSTLEHIDALVRDLHWLGIEWQEGEGVGGVHGPYRQSERDAIYAAYYQQLIDLGRAYPCYCSAEDLDLERKLQKASGQAPRYSGKCKRLTQADHQVLEAKGVKPTLRFKIQTGEVIQFKDGVKGLQSFKAEDIGDFIIRRNDGGSSFMFCNAIDDSLMGVTDVMRGEDHLTNTPRQLMILKALGMREPGYAHMALINGVDGAPLSKRNGSLSIEEMREAGFLPIAVLNYMARLGHYYEKNELMSYATLAQHFRLEALGSSAARFDPDQLLYWQRVAVHQLDEPALWNWFQVQNQVPLAHQDLFIKTVRENVLFPQDAQRYAQLLLTDDFVLTAHQDVLIQAGKAFFDLAYQTLSANFCDFKTLADTLSQRLNVKGKQLFMPLRVALTGELHGPQMAGILALLGQKEALRRLELARGLV
jgi:glutamyl-tRNA synthetase